jgi:hypothetical protein
MSKFNPEDPRWEEAERKRLYAENEELRMLLGLYLLKYQELREQNDGLSGGGIDEDSSVGISPVAVVTPDGSEAARTDLRAQTNEPFSGPEESDHEPEEDYPDADDEDGDPVTATLGRMYVSWCRRGGPLVSRYFMFDKYLQAKEPLAKVKPIYRDKTAAAIEFRESAADPVEYWLIEVGQSLYLLPQPLNNLSFREAEPCFLESDDCSPQSVGSVEPASLNRENGAYSLGAMGTLRSKDAQQEGL